MNDNQKISDLLQAYVREAKRQGATPGEGVFVCGMMAGIICHALLRSGKERSEARQMALAAIEEGLDYFLDSTSPDQAASHSAHAPHH